MMNEYEIGERVYRRVMEKKYADDGKTYVAACVCVSIDGFISVVFYKYENGKGIIGFARPTKEMKDFLLKHGGALKNYILKSIGDRKKYDEWRRAYDESISEVCKMRRRPLNRF